MWHPRCYMRAMAKTIALHEANDAFPRIIREVEAGEEFTITRDGEPVARLVPVRPLPIQGERVLTPEQQAARARARMEQGWDLGIDHPLDRDSLHER
jgi:prevent-host-death family protein